MNGATQGRRPWPSTLRRPTSSSSGSARSAASPRCRSRSAGLDVIGLEAGTWLSPRDFAPDELRNNFRGWPQSAQKANGEIPTHRPNASAPYSPRLPIHPMMNAVGGTTLHYWAQSWRLNPWDFKVVSETTRRYGAVAHPEGLDGRGLAVRARGARALLRQGRVRGRRLRPGRQHQRHDRSSAATSSRAPRARDYPMPPLRGTGFTEQDGDGRARARLASVPRPGRDQLADLREPLGLHVSRLLQPRRLPRRRQELDRGDDDPQGGRRPDGSTW